MTPPRAGILVGRPLIGPNFASIASAGLVVQSHTPLPGTRLKSKIWPFVVALVAAVHPAARRGVVDGWVWLMGSTMVSVGWVAVASSAMASSRASIRSATITHHLKWPANAIRIAVSINWSTSSGSLSIRSIKARSKTVSHFAMVKPLPLSGSGSVKFWPLYHPWPAEMLGVKRYKIRGFVKC